MREMAAELKRQAEVRRDFVSDTRQMGVQTVTGEDQLAELLGRPMANPEQRAVAAVAAEAIGSGLADLLDRPIGSRAASAAVAEAPGRPLVEPATILSMAGIAERFVVNRHAHGQLAARLGIPSVYYHRMRRDAPGLLDLNVNHWLRESAERRMVRTLDGHARAFMSDRYRRIDNDEIAAVVIPLLAEIGAEYASAQVTETRLYIKATFPGTDAEYRVGEVCRSGLVITNSEVGAGALSVEPMVYILACANGMIVPGRRVGQVHIGGHVGRGDGAEEIYSDETKAADDRALLLKVRDVVQAAGNLEDFRRIVGRMNAAGDRKVEGDKPAAVETLARTVGLGIGEGRSVLDQLCTSGDWSQMGMSNAITRISQDVEDYDRATELERIGGQVVTLGKSAWDMIAHAEAA